MSKFEDKSTDSTYVLTLLNTYAMLLNKTANPEKLQ